MNYLSCYLFIRINKDLFWDLYHDIIILALDEKREKNENFKS